MTIIPTGRHIIDFIALRPEFVGIGKATAKRLWDRYGTELYALLSAGEPSALSEVLDHSRASILIDAWRNQQALVDCVVFFEEQGIDTRVARKAIEFWGAEAVAKIKDNPYRLLSICSWTQIDAVALRLGLPVDDPRRRVAAVEGVLYDRLDRKHTWCVEEALIRLTSERLRVDIASATEAVKLAASDGAAVSVDGGYQAAGAAYIERYIEARIEHHLDRRSRRDLFLDSVDTAEVSAFIDRFSNSHSLTDEQSNAVHMALGNTFSLLVGGAGVGKTTVLKAVNAAARHFGMAVYQLAIAGRAASRMAEATGQHAQTVASWLRGVSDGKLEVGRHTLVVVDEASMLDLPTLYRILFHLPEEAPILLVGDTAQLPPIGFGLTLHRLISEERIPKTVLTRIHRASENSGIPAVSLEVRKGIVPSLRPYVPDNIGCAFVETSQRRIIDALEDIAHDLHREEIQIVAPTYRGEAGIDAINARFHSLNAASGRQSRYGFAVGDPCLWTVNDYDRGLWNGSLGVIVGFGEDVVSTEFGGVRHEIAPHELDHLELAYCISVHKAQGSQFRNVLVPMVQSFNLDRALLYTAITRATNRVVLVGDRNAMESAIAEAPRSFNRDVGLRLRDVTG